jgi:hypothetical protein
MNRKLFFLIIIFSILFLSKAISQTTIQIDLADKKASSQQIDLNVKDAILINKAKDFSYKTSWKRKKIITPVLELLPSLSGGTAAADDEKLKKCSPEVAQALVNLSSNDEAKVKIGVQTVTQLLGLLSDQSCKDGLSEKIKQTKEAIDFPFKGSLDYNQIITLEITKIDKSGKEEKTWSYTFTTEEKSRWLVHYGLTYAPNLISKVDHYYAFADTGVANKYTIKKNNNSGPKSWDNISATINFTYPFHADPRPLDGGFTAGFGLNPDLQLSGHAGFSFVIGDNVIIGSGIAFMQKYKLKGEYQENQIIKTNLDFTALHEKVWLPELYFTIGFRFNSNPFAKSSNNNSQTQSPTTNNLGTNNNTNSRSTNSTNTNTDSTKLTDSTEINKDTTSPIGFFIPAFPGTHDLFFSNNALKTNFKIIEYVIPVKKYLWSHKLWLPKTWIEVV